MSDVVVVPIPVNESSYEPQGEFTVAVIRCSDGARLTDHERDLWEAIDGTWFEVLAGNGALSSGLPQGEAVLLSIQMSIELQLWLRNKRSPL